MMDFTRTYEHKLKVTIPYKPVIAVKPFPEKLRRGSLDTPLL